MAIRVGINGFGRIGRLVFRAICDQGLLGKGIDVVAVNDLVPADNLAYLVKYDSVQGRFKGEVRSEKSSPNVAEDDTLVVDGNKIKCLAVKEGPAALPWKDLNVDIVVESTGLFTEAEKAEEPTQQFTYVNDAKGRHKLRIVKPGELQKKASGERKGKFREHISGVIDTLLMAREMFPGKSNNLDALCRRLEVDNSHRTLHGALMDAELLAEVYINMTRGQDALLIDSDASENGEGQGTQEVVAIDFKNSPPI